MLDQNFGEERGGGYGYHGCGGQVLRGNRERRFTGLVFVVRKASGLDPALIPCALQHSVRASWPLL